MRGACARPVKSPGKRLLGLGSQVIDARVSVKPLLFAVALLASPLMACTANVIGEGDGPDRGAGFGGEQADGGTTSEEGSSSSSVEASEYDALFDAPADATTTDDALHGVWAGTTFNTRDDLRLGIRSDKLTIAIRCGSAATVGLEVTAKVSPSSIRVLASKSAAKRVPGKAGNCGIDVRPVTIPRCDETRDIECFNLSGTALSFVGVWLFEVDNFGPNDDFTKLSD